MLKTKHQTVGPSNTDRLRMIQILSVYVNEEDFNLSLLDEFCQSMDFMLKNGMAAL